MTRTQNRFMNNLNTHLDITFALGNVADFVDYCQDFYDKDRSGSIYPFATEAEIQIAVLAHVSDPNPSLPFDGDSADRELVRDRILFMRKLIGGETDWAVAVNTELVKRGAPESHLIQTLLPDGTLTVR